MPVVHRSITTLLCLALAACGSSGTPDRADAATAAPDANDAPDAAPIDPLDAERLGALATELSSDEMKGRESGTPAAAAARAILDRALRGCGVTPLSGDSFEQPFGAQGGVNLLGYVPGTDAELGRRHVLLGAHYDHLGEIDGEIFNGAYDNATAVSVVVGLACALVKNPLPRSVLVALWDAEEPPYFRTADMGSQAYANNPVLPLAETDVAIALDLVGAGLWPGYQGHFVLGAELSPQVTAAVARVSPEQGLKAFRGGLHLVEQQMTPSGPRTQPWSDYDAFRNLNRPVLFFSDGQNVHYHQPSDDMAHVDLAKLEREARYLLALLQSLGAEPGPFTFAAGGADHLADARMIRTILEDALAPQGLVEALGLTSTSRQKLESDLAKVGALVDKLTGGGTAVAAEVQALRSAGQRVMCLAGKSYPENVCGML